MVNVSVHFSQADLQAFKVQMDRIIRELGKAPEAAVNMGAFALIKSLRASIKRGKKWRKVVESESGKGQIVNLKGKDGSTTENKIFWCERWSKKKKQMVKVPIFAPDLATAEKSPKAKIKFAGLGAAVFGWSMQRLFGKGGPNVTFRRPQGIENTSKRGKGNEYTITIENNTNYIPFRTKGKTAVSTAMVRATAAMRGRTEQRLKGTFK